MGKRPILGLMGACVKLRRRMNPEQIYSEQIHSGFFGTPRPAQVRMSLHGSNACIDPHAAPGTLERLPFTND